MNRYVLAVFALATGLIAACSSDDPTEASDTHVADDTSTTVADSATSDTGASDSGASDSGTSDTGASDSGTSDSGASDSGTVDSGADDSQTIGSDTSGDVVEADIDDAVAPECVMDGDCAVTAIIAPNACLVRRCIEGTCQLAEPDCADEDPCTFDACDPHAGCVHIEQVQDIGSSRVRLCSGPLSQDAAAAACSAIGEDPATADDDHEALAFAQMLGDLGLDAAWVSPLTPDLCPQVRRMVLPQCKSLAATACTALEACIDALPFFCEITCNDGDPCTTDVVGDDGLCTTDGKGCDDDDACTTDSCDPREGCVHVVMACDDGVACTTDTCDSKSGECVHTVVRAPWDATHELVACPGPLSWTAARTRCANDGAVLAMPVNDTQEGLLADIAAAAGATSALWAPLKQQDGGNQPWDWTDGGGSGTPPWCASVMPNFSEAGYCGAWSSSDACVLDVPCTELRSFGCVIDLSVP